MYERVVMVVGALGYALGLNVPGPGRLESSAARYDLPTGTFEHLFPQDTSSRIQLPAFDVDVSNISMAAVAINFFMVISVLCDLLFPVKRLRRRRVNGRSRRVSLCLNGATVWVKLIKWNGLNFAF
jgi:hypothetical protein